MGAKQAKQIVEVLHSVPLLSKLTTSELEELSRNLSERKFENGQAVITQGDVGEDFYIIKSGKAIVSKVHADGKSHVLAKLHEGDYFGETALLTNAKRGATVTAIGLIETLYLGREKFNTLFSPEKLNIKFAKRKAVSAEKDKKAGVVSRPQDAKTEKSPSTAKFILKCVRENVLFLEQNVATCSKIVAEMYCVTIPPGSSPIVQGDLGDNFYVVEKGNFDVFVSNEKKESHKVATRGPGTCFGELALMYTQPRAATVTAVEESVVWVVDRYTFRRIVTSLTEHQLSKYLNFLKKVELLAPLSTSERNKIAEALEEVWFDPGSIVVGEGDSGDCMYIVQEGELVITKNGEEIARTKTGDYFGERALLKSEPRAATVVACDKCCLLKLDSNAFGLLLGPLEHIIHKTVEGYEKENRVRESMVSFLKKNDKKHIKQKTNISFTDLEVVGTLGKGSFGHVQLVQDRNTKITYAMKAVFRQQVVDSGQQSHVMSEKKVMMLLDHPFLIKLFQTFKDKHRLYFLLEPALGGELFTILRDRTLFDEDEARFYAGSVVLAFEYMHSLNIVYRDLKPENILLDRGGYVKITDFGFAKDVSEGRTWTLCGTPDYLAPEIVAGKGHHKGVDWWTLGVFIYEMLASYPPFYDDDPLKTYAKIMHNRISYPAHFSKEAVNIIKKLLHHKPTKRLGVVKGGAKSVKKHPWFKNAESFTFEALLGRRLRPTFIPTIANPSDLSNFDDYPEDEDNFIEYTSHEDGWDVQF